LQCKTRRSNAQRAQCANFKTEKTILYSIGYAARRLRASHGAQVDAFKNGIENIRGMPARATIHRQRNFAAGNAARSPKSTFFDKTAADSRK
jgi:hypothetical protein